MHFFYMGPADDRFHVADVLCDPLIPSFVLSAPPFSSLYLDTNEKIDLQAIGSLGCWSLHLCQTNQMWGGEPSELLVAKDYQIVVRAKPLHVIDKTFCSIPTDGANCCYLDRLTFEVLESKPTKKGVRGKCVGRLSDD